MRIAIVDDHALVRAGLIKLLSARYEIVGEAADAGTGLELVRRTAPDIVLLDLSLPDRDGLSAIPDFLSASPEMRILVLGEQREVANLGEVLGQHRASALASRVHDLRLPHERRLRRGLPVRCGGYRAHLLRTWP